MSAVTVRVSPDEKSSSLHITISPYIQGTAVYRLENLTNNLTVKFRQRLELIVSHYNYNKPKHDVGVVILWV